MTPTVPVRRRERPADPRRSSGRPDWARVADVRRRGRPGCASYWYPVAWSSQVGRKPMAVEVGTEPIVLHRDVDGTAYGLHDRCPHRGVPLSLGQAGVPRHDHLPVPRLDVPASRRRARRGHHRRAGLADLRQGRASRPTRSRRARPGLGVPRRRRAAPADAQLPEELVERAADGRRRPDRGPRRQLALAAENGFDEGHAKYLHRTSLLADVQGDADVEQGRTSSVTGRWIYRVQDERHWDADVPGPRARGPTSGGGSASRKRRRAIARQHGRARRSPTRTSRPGLPGVRVAGHAGHAAHRLPAASSTTSSTCPIDAERTGTSA